MLCVCVFGRALVFCNFPILSVRRLQLTEANAIRNNIKTRKC